MATHTHAHTRKEGAWRGEKKQQQKETLCVCKVFGVFCKKCRSFEFMILNTHTQQRLNSRFIHMAAPPSPLFAPNTFIWIALQWGCDLLAYSLCPLCCTFAASLNMEINLEFLAYSSPLLQISRSRSMRTKTSSYPARWMRISAGNCTRWTGSRAMIASLPCCWAIVMSQAWTMNLKIGKWTRDNIMKYR